MLVNFKVILFLDVRGFVHENFMICNAVGGFGSGSRFFGIFIFGGWVIILLIFRFVPEIIFCLPLQAHRAQSHTPQQPAAKSFKTLSRT